MTASVTVARRRDARLAYPAVAAISALGCGALAARPALLTSTQHPMLTLTVLFSALLAVGVALPLPRHFFEATSNTHVIGVAIALGVIAFGAGRVLIGGHAPARATLVVMLANVLAAIAEEVWFRRLCFGLLAPVGPGVAVAGSTLLFAAVHVSIYGFWILPLDLAAGALFGWQRAVTGSWVAPAVTHAVANVFVLL